MKAQQTGAEATGPGGTYRPTREGRAFRMAFVSPILYFIGTLCWIAGAGLGCGAYPRSLDVSGASAARGGAAAELHAM